jgi:hypothetical protein
MGRFYGGNRQELGFPDEFGVDICQGEQEKKLAAAGPNPMPPGPFCGYVSSNWFGPFLLSPPARRERGWC